MSYMLFTSSAEVVEMAKLLLFFSTSSSARNWLPIKSEARDLLFKVFVVCVFFSLGSAFSADNVFCQF